jgi:polysaccharide biosynthesis protein VpsM
MKQKQLFLIMAAMVGLGAASVAPAWAEDAADAVPAGTAESLPPSSSAVKNPANSIAGSAYESSGIPIGTSRQKNPIRAGGVNIYADVATDYGYDDNVTQSNAASAASSSYFGVRPTVAAEVLHRADSYALAYLGDYRRYPDYDANNTNTNNLLFNASNVFTGRASLAWGLAYMDVHDPLGSTDRSSGTTTTPDHHRDLMANATFRYGAEDAKGKLEFDAGVGNKRYLNNHITTESADVDNTNLGARFFYRVAPKTQLFVEGSRTTYDYQNDILLLTNTDYRYLLGAKWDVTAATTGTIKLGEQFKQFDSSSRNDFTGFSWEASIRWKPLTYSTVDFLAGRSATDPSGANVSYVITQNNSVSWRHDWTNYFHSTAAAGYQRSHYAGSDRSDRLNTYSAGVMYDMRRWLGIGLEYNYTRRHSTEDTYDYLRHLTLLKLEASF